MCKKLPKWGQHTKLATHRPRRDKKTKYGTVEKERRDVFFGAIRGNFTEERREQDTALELSPGEKKILH